MPIEYLSKLMGHTEVDTTLKHYARWQTSTDLRMLDLMNAGQSAQTGHKADTANG